MNNAKPIDVTIVGGGMITHDLLLPSIYHLQRSGVVGDITVCALNTPPLKALKESPELLAAFPGQSFTARPSLDNPPDAVFPDLFKEVLAGMPSRQAVVVAMPDPLHYSVVMEAFKNNQHVLCVKPLVLKYEQAVEVEQLGKEKGLFCGVEYHKRFDARALMAKRHYADGNFGEFIMGEAKMIEPYFYRHSNFQNWFTCDKTDPFVYVGCHYVDLVCFITGLRPSAVSVSGVKGRFPNGKEGYMWANGRVIFENGAILSVTDGLGYPDDGAGSNEQCLSMFFEGDDKGGALKHDDQFRGVCHSYLGGIGCAGSVFNFVSPDFYQLVPWEGEGLKPVGYGFASVAATITTIQRIEAETAEMNEADALERRRTIIREADEKGLIATPANSSVNELVMEAARMSILNDGAMVDIVYGENPHVALRNH
jgi:predicted dehydrogenase